MEAYLQSQNDWMPISMPSLAPQLSEKPTSEEKREYREWQKEANVASGLIHLMVKDDQRIYLNDYKDQPDKMWEALKQIHMQQCPGTCFHAYDGLFSIRKGEEENLQTLINRVEIAKKKIQDSHPKDFDIDKLDNELASMALIRVLSNDFSAFVFTLPLKDGLDKAKIHQAFVTEKTQHHHCSDESAAAIIAMSAALAKAVCDFCTLQGHTQATCYMTPHQNWVQNYAPHCTPLRLADNSIIYSAGIETVVFHPVVNGKQSLEFYRVLHVPLL
ncbi:hypothetical protein J132_04363 [Termitomyces sp. J132]|nr:hypothetical protein J132_04363 [Termitomyces sp. J132]